MSAPQYDALPGELWAHLLAYNLIRLLMAQAAHGADRHPRELSFKHTVQPWTEWTAQRDLAGNLARDRPDQIEPRARKRRPKSYPWLKIPRTQARQQIRVFGHLLEALVSAIGLRPPAH